MQGIIFFMEKEKKIMNWEEEFYTPHNSISSDESRVC